MARMENFKSEKYEQEIKLTKKDKATLLILLCTTIVTIIFSIMCFSDVNEELRTIVFIIDFILILVFDLMVDSN